MSRIIYIANVRIPTEKAHGIQIMKMCESFALAGAELTLVVPNRGNEITADPFDFYKVRRAFTIKKLPILDFGAESALAFIATMLSFYASLFFYLLREKRRDVVLYTRGETVLALTHLWPRRPFAWETHIKPGNMSRYKKVLQSAVALVTVTEYYARELEREYGVPAAKLLTAPDGVDLEDFTLDIGKAEARRKLGLPEDKKIALYTGHLYDWKGADTLAEAASHLGEGEMVAMVGGTAEDLARFRSKYGSIAALLIVGHKPHSEMKYYLKAADVLVMPNSAKSTTSQFYTSPLKLFEYMASGVPIVASDLVSLREILNEENAVFFRPDDAADLARAIKGVFADAGKAERLGRRALSDVQNYTWEKRGRAILSLIKSRLG